MATPDLSVFGKIKTVDDFNREAEEFDMRKKAAALAEQLGQAKLNEYASGSNLPATIQVANEIQKAIKAGDMDRANLLFQSGKLLDKGVLPYGSSQPQALPNAQESQAVELGIPEDLTQLTSFDEAVPPMNLGSLPERQVYNVAPIPGYGQAVGSIEAAKKGMETQAQKDVELGMNPQIKAAEKQAEMQSEYTQKAKQDLGQSGENTRQVLDLLDQIEQSPGLSSVVGVPNPLGGRVPFFGNIPGSNAADFQAKLDQLGGKQFLEAFQSLKGGGAITEIEGQKASNAIARMQTSQSESAFKDALNEFKEIVQRGAQRAQQKAGVPNTPAQPSIETPSAPARGSVSDGYMFMGGDPSQQSSWKKVK